jgi:hypothetical protein
MEDQSMAEVKLESLVGERKLSGVDMGKTTVERYGSTEEANHISFVLDGIVYTATEDPDDGYRSYMGTLSVGGSVANTFAPQCVLCSYYTGKIDEDSYYTANELLIARDVVTGKEVLRIGTSNTDDYYPWFTADFDPTAMACNAPSGDEKHG